MKKRSDPLSVRFYRRALVLLPRDFRRLRGAAMVAMLADEWRERRGTPRGVLMVRALFDLVWTAIVERLRPVGGRLHGPTVAERVRDAAAGRMGLSWLDVKLGFRMLIRYPGLTVVGALAMAFAICVGAATFEFLTQVVNPTLPLDEGDRIVVLRNLDALRPWDRTPSRAEARALHDFVTWREELESVEEIGAYRTLPRNLITAGGLGEPVDVAGPRRGTRRDGRYLPGGVPGALRRDLAGAGTAADRRTGRRRRHGRRGASLMYHGWNQIEVDQGALTPRDFGPRAPGQLGDDRGGLLRGAGRSDPLGPGLSFR